MVSYENWFGRKIANKIREILDLPYIPPTCRIERLIELERHSREKNRVMHFLTFTMLDNIEWKFSLLVRYLKRAFWFITPIKNAWLFREVLTNYHPSCSSGMLTFLEVAARDMAKADIDAHKNRERSLLVFAERIKRIHEDDYTSDKISCDVNANRKPMIMIYQKDDKFPRYKDNSGTFYKLINKQREHDKEEAARLFTKYIITLWSD